MAEKNSSEINPSLINRRRHRTKSMVFTTEDLDNTPEKESPVKTKQDHSNNENEFPLETNPEKNYFCLNLSSFLFLLVLACYFIMLMNSILKLNLW